MLAEIDNLFWLWKNKQSETNQNKIKDVRLPNKEAIDVVWVNFFYNKFLPTRNTNKCFFLGNGSVVNRSYSSFLLVKNWSYSFGYGRLGVKFTLSNYNFRIRTFHFINHIIKKSRLHIIVFKQMNSFFKKRR